MSPRLKVGDKVRTATALTASHWSQGMMACRRPDAEGVVVLVPPALHAGCSECRNQGRYVVEHNLGNRAHYHGDELTLVTQGAPEPDDEPDGGRLGERVEGLVSGFERLERKLRTVAARVAALEQPLAPEPVDHSAAVEKARAWCKLGADRRDAVLGRISWIDGVYDEEPTAAMEALRAVPDLVRALNEQPPPAATQSPPRSVLEAYRALHRAVTKAKARECWISQDMGKALHVLEQLGVTPDKPPAPVHDDSSLDVKPQPVRCPRCGGEPWREPTCHELLQLWRRLNESGAYTVSDPAALAEAALRDRETVRLQMRELTATKLQYGAMHDELSGIHQQLLEAVDGEPEATTDELLARVLRRAEPMQRIIELREPEELRLAATGLRHFAGGDDLATHVAAMLKAAAAISEEERD